jgi:DNA-binding response OmpR family regulator
MCSARIEGVELVAGARRIPLTESELRIVGRLLEDAGKVVTRAELTQSLWGIQDPDTGRAIDTHVRRIRNKIDGVPGLSITTIRMRGFRLEVQVHPPGGGPAQR